MHTRRALEHRRGENGSSVAVVSHQTENGTEGNGDADRSSS